MKKSVKNLRIFLLLIAVALGGIGSAYGQKDKFKPGKYIVPQPVLEWQKLGEDKGSDGKIYLNIKFGIKNWQAFPDKMFAAAPDLPACGDNKNSSQTWLQIYDYANDKRIYGFCALNNAAEMKSRNFNVAREEKPDCIYITLIDRRTDKIFKSNPIRFTSDKPCPAKKEVIIN